MVRYVMLGGSQGGDDSLSHDPMGNVRCEGKGYLYMTLRGGFWMQLRGGRAVAGRDGISLRDAASGYLDDRVSGTTRVFLERRYAWA
jgi:hypothetical protein